MTADELVVVANVALGAVPVENCAAADRDRNAVVTVDEILGGIRSALVGCPLPDLVFVVAFAVYPMARGCNMPPVGDFGLRVCVANRGLGTAGTFRVRVNDSDVYAIDMLASKAQDCRLRPLPFSSPFSNMIVVDVDDDVHESNEGNNSGSFGIAVLTPTPSCTIGPSPSPTPQP